MLQLVDEDATIMPGVRVRRTGGHTMHHQMVIIESAGKTAVFAADLLPTAAHLPEVWVMGYDLFPLDTLDFKRAFLREAIEREYLDHFRARSRDRRGLHTRARRETVRRACGVAQRVRADGRGQMADNVQIGVIGGSGLYDMAELTDREEKTLKTPFGDAVRSVS